MNSTHTKLYSFTESHTEVINNFLFKEDKTFIDRLIGFIKLPFYFYILIIEKYLKKYFDKQIFESLMGSESIVEQLDKNEFGYKNFELVKKDIIETDSFYNTFQDIELKRTIQNEFESFVIEMVRSSDIIFDIENFLKVLVNIENKNGVRIYSVTICYYKNPYIIKLQKYVVKNLIILFTGILIGFIIYSLIFNLI